MLVNDLNARVDIKVHQGDTVAYYCPTAPSTPLLHCPFPPDCPPESHTTTTATIPPQNRLGRVALHSAAASGHAEVVRILLDAKRAAPWATGGRGGAGPRSWRVHIFIIIFAIFLLIWYLTPSDLLPMAPRTVRSSQIYYKILLHPTSFDRV